MKENYSKVPYIITGKDLDYLTDMFNWNYGALKTTNEAITKVKDREIKKLLADAFKLFNNNINSVLNILGGKNE